jgi:putative membrane protein
MWMHGYPYGGFGLGFGLLGFLMPILFIVAVVWLVIAATRSERGIKESSGDSALKILKERYAKGEIDKKEYEDKKKDLQ